MFLDFHAPDETNTRRGKSQPKITKKLLDISPRGLAFLVPEDELAIFPKGSELKDCFLLIKGQRFSVRAQIMHVSPFQRRLGAELLASSHKVGVQFLEIHADCTAAISALVMKGLRRSISAGLKEIARAA